MNETTKSDYQRTNVKFLKDIGREGKNDFSLWTFIGEFINEKEYITVIDKWEILMVFLNFVLFAVTVTMTVVLYLNKLSVIYVDENGKEDTSMFTIDRNIKYAKYACTGIISMIAITKIIVRIYRKMDNKGLIPFSNTFKIANSGVTHYHVKTS